MPKSAKDQALEELDAEEAREGEGGMVSLKRTPKEKKAQQETLKSPSVVDGEDYPWGLTITLDKDTLDKLGMDNLPKLGGTVKLEAVAKVVGASMNTSESHDSREVRLQLTDMKLEPGSK